MIERTLIILKPDAVRRHLTGKILAIFEEMGLAIVALKQVSATAELMKKHYAFDDAWKIKVGGFNIADAKTLLGDKSTNYYPNDPLAAGALIEQQLRESFLTGPVVPAILEGEAAIAAVRKVVGKTFPCDADPSSIRGRFSTDTPQAAMLGRRPVDNLIHASDAPATAAQEMALWFPDLKL